LGLLHKLPSRRLSGRGMSCLTAAQTEVEEGMQRCSETRRMEERALTPGRWGWKRIEERSSDGQGAARRQEELLSSKLWWMSIGNMT